MRIWFVLALLSFSFIANLFAEQKAVTIAVLEFRNKTETIRRWNGRNLAKRMEEQLKKKGKFQKVDSDKLKAIAEADNSLTDRLERESEIKIKNLGADYLLYSVVSEWQAGSYHASLTGSAHVICYFTLIDLNTGKEKKSFYQDGSSAGYVSRQEDYDPATFDESRTDEVFEDATKRVLDKAAETITTEITALPPE